MIDQTKFQTQAVERLRQEIPESLDWLPWRELPAMRWSVDATPVDRRVPRGWLVIAEERGIAEPDLELQQQAALLNCVDAANLGVWLLREWIDHDTVDPKLTTERKLELRLMAEHTAEVAERFNRGGSDPDERYQQLLALEENRPAPSALSHQGLLAVVAVCGDSRTAADAEHYLATWHGNRVEQCQALLQMLSWVTAAAAGEVLSGARRFVELRETAEKLIEARADRG